MGGVAAAGVVALAIVGAAVFFGGDDGAALASSTPSASASVEPGPCPQTDAPAQTAPKPTFTDPPDLTIDPAKTYVATFKTSCGTFSAELLAAAAPEAVNSFVFLADRGYYDGLVFHRIVKDFVIQSGDPRGDGSGGPGYEIPVTVTRGASFDAAGVLAFGHSSTGGNGSQFFVTLAPSPNLDPPNGPYTIFGKVTDGLKVVDKIGRTPTVVGLSGEQSSPTYPIFVLKVTITES